MGSDKVDGMILVERKIEPEQNNVIPRQNAFAASLKPPIDSTRFFFGYVECERLSAVLRMGLRIIFSEHDR